jgi:DNA gyrase/topoisomerase IV subunit A
MPEENENAKADAVVEQVAEGVISPDEAAEVADITEVTDDAQAAETGAEETPFDRKQAEAKIRKVNAEAQNLRKRLKELEPKAAELQRLKDAEKSDTERLTDQLAAANERITKTRERLVRTQVQALAATSFADADDPLGELDLDSYIDSDGDIDEAAIKADLQALLERKPHWAKSQPQEGPRRPAPDRTQASGANNKQAPLTPEDEFQGFLHAQLK